MPATASPATNGADPSDTAPVTAAKTDLAAQLAMDVAEIEVVEATTVTWSDGSLGCPQPGMMYPQVTVEGMKIVLRAQGQIYEYHSGGNRAPFLCEHPAP